MASLDRQFVGARATLATLPRLRQLSGPQPARTTISTGVVLWATARITTGVGGAAVVGFLENQPRPAETFTPSARALSPCRKTEPPSAPAVPVIANTVSTWHDQSALELLSVPRAADRHLDRRWPARAPSDQAAHRTQDRLAVDYAHLDPPTPTTVRRGWSPRCRRGAELLKTDEDTWTSLATSQQPW